MRSAFFQKPLEYQIQTEEEEWNQGDRIQGRLRVRNNGIEETGPLGVRLLLAHGVRKVVKSGDSAAWDVLSEQNLLEEQNLDSKDERKIEWTIQLPSNCPITDKSASLFLLFGGVDVLQDGGRIDLNISLHPILQSFLQTFTTQFKFLEKYRKSKGEWTEIKLEPPYSKDFPNMNHLICLLRIRDEMLDAHFTFKMKSFGRDGESVKVVSKKREFELKLRSTEYLQPGGFPNRNLFREKILEALNIVRQKVVF